jgi:hypothetical protein
MLIRIPIRTVGEWFTLTTRLHALERAQIVSSSLQHLQHFAWNDLGNKRYVRVIRNKFYGSISPTGRGRTLRMISGCTFTKGLDVVLETSSRILLIIIIISDGCRTACRRLRTRAHDHDNETMARNIIIRRCLSIFISLLKRVILLLRWHANGRSTTTSRRSR